MTTPAQLIHLISDVTGVPLPTVVDIDRKLRMGGLRSKNGRGLNAARMTALDAARILTALLGSAQANQSVETVKRYGEAVVDQARSSDGLFSAAGFNDLGSLPARHSFVEGITGLIASASTGSLAAMIAQGAVGWMPNIEVFAFTAATYGRIRISGLPSRAVANVEYLPTANGRNIITIGDAAGTSSRFIGDLEQSRRISERTILSIARLLAQEKNT